MTAEIAGAIILGVPLLILELAVLRRQPRPILLFAIVLLLVGLGYLMAVGATGDIARAVLPSQFSVVAPVKA